jgi:hypothetical protein
MSSQAPIALFVYNRPLHTRRTIEALRANVGADRSDLFVFSDSAANDAAIAGVAEVRRQLRSVDGFRSVAIIERERNFGLARSIIDGVTRLCDERGRAIVVEDDLLTSRWFLKYLNDGLDTYADDHEVASIHAYLPPLARLPEGNFFMYGTDCWGWATWQRAWQGFIADGEELLRRLAGHPRRRYFDYLGNWPHTTMLKGYLAGRNNSWAIRWHASMFLEGRLTLHPGRTLVNNIGLDGSGTHCSDNDDMNSAIVDEPMPVARIPLEHSTRIWRRKQRYYAGQFLRRAIRKLLP